MMDQFEDSDGEPENISFATSKLETVDNMQKIKDQIAHIRESQKEKRKQRQQLYIEQKENLDVPNEVLSEIKKIKVQSEETFNIKKEQNKSRKTFGSPQKRRFIDEDLIDSTVSDFIPLKSYKSFGISVVNLANTNKKPLIASEAAKNFRNEAFNRKGIVRQTDNISNRQEKKEQRVWLNDWH